MDKYEYKVRSEEISKLIDKEKYAEAVKIADTIDWRRVKSASMLLKIAALYRISRRNEDSREMLMLAYERYPTNRSVVYSLCELSIELDDVVAAIEYYKQFAKLAPKDNGVYTLRYRILEAQEASLEERIEILEELKKKDYQEEWAYELAYLYHRVGLSTKCVEECDDIILWFGDGPYVMKAMELKAKHVPLTEIQQKNYDIMLGNAGQNYSNGNYNVENYDSDDYNDEGYDGQNYNTEGYDEQNYSAADYDRQNYDSEDYADGNYDAANYDIVNDNEAYANEGYGQESYVNEPYGNEAYVNEGYEQESYSNEQYADDNYGQNNFVDDGYGNLSYVDASYQNNGYTGEFYVEQIYDENGNLINLETYTDSDYSQDSYDYPQDEGSQDNSYVEQASTPKEYRNGLRLVENTAAPTGNPSDMSQYNTINLQKVVAESMKELFPDDGDDVFAEDREKYNSSEDIGNITGDTRVFAGIANPDAANKRFDNNDNNIDTADEPSGLHIHTGRVRIAQMVTGVLEKAPEPHTGAIKKILVPGDDARLIKSDSNMDELRDTTEKSVDDEHNRMEYNDENVYHEQSIMDINESDETSQAQTTGSMKLDEVLVEWERMKQDNAKKHQEEIKKRVLTQTGKIFANFDNSIKSGILGELEREETEAQTSNASPKGKDGFLEADVTDDIPQQPASEDDFDVEYVTDHMQSAKLQESAASEQSENSEASAREEYLSELGHAVSQELVVSIEEASAEEVYTKKAADNVVDEYTQEIPVESAVDYGAGEYTEETFEEGVYVEDVDAADYETDAYTEETFEEGVADYEADEYTQKISTEGVVNYDVEDSEYTDEAYEEEATGYAEEAYNAGTDKYTEGIYGTEADNYVDKSYAEDSGEYTEEVYAENSGEYTEELFVEGTAFYAEENEYRQEDTGEYTDEFYTEDAYDELEDAYSESSRELAHTDRRQKYQYNEKDLDPEDAESIAEMAKEDALKTQEIKMNTADLSSLSEKIVATTKKEASGAKREEIRDFTPEEQILFENFAVTKKIKKQIIYALENMTLASYIGNVIITGDAGLDTVKMAKNLIKEYQALDENFSGKLAKITGEKINQRNIKDVFEKLNNGGIIIEKANGMSEEKLYEMALSLTQDNLAIVVIMEDTKKEITKLLQKQAMIVDYFNIRIDLMEMDNNALVAYAKNYALALEYSIDELGTLALYTRIANMQSGNHVVTKDEVRDIIDEAIWKSKKSKIKNFVDVLFARRYDNEDMIVLKERDFM